MPDQARSSRARRILVGSGAIFGVIGLAAWLLSVIKHQHGTLPWILFSASVSILLLLGIAFLLRGSRKLPGLSRGESGSDSLGAVNNILAISSSILSAISAVLSIIVAYASLNSPATKEPLHHPKVNVRDLCAVPLGGPAHLAELSESDQLDSGSTFSDVHYSLYSSDSDHQTAQLNTAMYGRLRGTIRTGHAIYVMVTFSPGTTSDEGVRGYDHFYPRGRIIAGGNDCWAVPNRNLGHPGTIGIQARILFMLIPDSSLATLEHEKEITDEDPGGNDPGFTRHMLNKMGAVSLYYFDMNTDNYDTVP